MPVGWAILGWGGSRGRGRQLPDVPGAEGPIHDPGFRVRAIDLDLGIDYLSYWNHHYVAPGYYYDVSEVDLHAGWPGFLADARPGGYPKVALGYGIASYSYCPGWNRVRPLEDGGHLPGALTLRGELGVAA